MNKRIRKKRVRQMFLAELTLAFNTPEEAVVWLDTPVAALEDRTPREAFVAGEVERVTLLLDAMNGSPAESAAGAE
jgi:uncharacterized protein (DUF2384 family)